MHGLPLKSVKEPSSFLKTGRERKRIKHLLSWLSCTNYTAEWPNTWQREPSVYTISAANTWRRDDGIRRVHFAVPNEVMDLGIEHAGWQHHTKRERPPDICASSWGLRPLPVKRPCPQVKPESAEASTPQAGKRLLRPTTHLLPVCVNKTLLKHSYTHLFK